MSGKGMAMQNNKISAILLLIGKLSLRLFPANRGMVNNDSHPAGNHSGIK